MEALHLQPVKSGFMRHIITVHDVLALFPHRKKSYCYNLLASIRDATERKVVTVQDLASFTGLDESTVRDVIRSR